MTTTIIPCDLCASADIESPATWRSSVGIRHWLGQAGSHTAHVCDACREHACPAESDDAGTCSQADLVPLA